MKYKSNEEVFASIEDKWFKEEKEKGKDIEFEDIYYHNVKNIIEKIRAEDRKANLLDVEELFMFNSDVGQSVIYADDFTKFLKAKQEE